LLPTADVLSTIVKRSMLTDVDKLSSCSRFSDSVVGFTGQKTQPTARTKDLSLARGDEAFPLGYPVFMFRFTYVPCAHFALIII